MLRAGLGEDKILRQRLWNKLGNSDRKEGLWGERRWVTLVPLKIHCSYFRRRAYKGNIHAVSKSLVWKTHVLFS